VIYQERFMNLTIYDESYDIFCALLPPRPTVFEIGCGPGNISKYILHKRPDCNLEGIDNAPRMIDLARVHNPTARFSIMDCRALDLITQTYDAIVCGFCIPYLSTDDCAKLFRDCRQLLNSGGYLYLSYVDGPPSLSGYKSGSTGSRMYFYYHRLTTLQSQLSANGFKVLQVMNIPFTREPSITEIHTVVIIQNS
jgi:SAM-dependent methyltransferase